MRHDRHLRLPRAVVAFASLGALALTPGVAQADVGGVGFWLPGSMGSLSAVPGQAGWSFTSVYLHLEANAGGGKELQNNASIVTGLHARADALGFLPAYTFETPVLGGQLTVGAAGVPGNVGLNIGAALTGPGGNQVSGNARDERSTFADVYYLATLKWNQGVNNYMWFVLGNIPSGTYDPTRLANLSPGYTAVDSGVGYTYLDPHTGHELSAVAGFTYNGMNEALQYRNGIDFHGRYRNSSAKVFSSASPAMSTSRLPVIAARVRSSAISRAARSVSARRLASSFPRSRDTRVI
jgi:hypothetical protein